MMEPGEAPALWTILLGAEAEAHGAGAEAAGRAEAAGHAGAIDLAPFVRWLLAHEIFVAVDKASGRPVGFAAARDLVDLYWLFELLVAPEHRGAHIEAALLNAVTARARWFFHRALGVSPFRNVVREKDRWNERGFVTVARDDLPADLEQRLQAARPVWAGSKEWCIMVKWL